MVYTVSKSFINTPRMMTRLPTRSIDWRVGETPETSVKKVKRRHILLSLRVSLTTERIPVCLGPGGGRGGGG